MEYSSTLFMRFVGLFSFLAPKICMQFRKSSNTKSIDIFKYINLLIQSKIIECYWN